MITFRDNIPSKEKASKESVTELLKSEFKETKEIFPVPKILSPKLQKKEVISLVDSNKNPQIDKEKFIVTPVRKALKKNLGGDSIGEPVR